MASVITAIGGRRTIGGLWYHRAVSEQPNLNESFAELLIHLAQMVALYLGDLADPSGERMEPQPEAARQFIDRVAKLQEKTSGHLTPAEATARDDLLYDLRLRFVEAGKGERRIIEP